jgi:hypothetical protein
VTALERWEKLYFELMHLLVAFDSLMFEAKYTREAMLSFLLVVVSLLSPALVR